jgi:hypothetical protein
MKWEEEWARAGRASAQRLVARFSLLCPVPEECAQSSVGGRNATRRDVIIFSHGWRQQERTKLMPISHPLPSNFYHFQRTENSGTIIINGKTCQSDIFPMPLI